MNHNSNPGPIPAGMPKAAQLHSIADWHQRRGLRDHKDIDLRVVEFGC